MLLTFKKLTIMATKIISSFSCYPGQLGRRGSVTLGVSCDGVPFVRWRYPSMDRPVTTFFERDDFDYAMSLAHQEYFRDLMFLLSLLR